MKEARRKERMEEYKEMNPETQPFHRMSHFLVARVGRSGTKFLGG